MDRTDFGFVLTKDVLLKRGGSRLLSFEWDLANIAHLARHRITRLEVEELLEREPRQEGHDVVDGEDRWTVVGSTEALRILTIVFTIRGDSIRPITGWDADKKSIARYFEGN